MAGRGLRSGEPLEWIGPAITQGGPDITGAPVTLRPGARGIYVTEDFDDFIVVDFDPLGTFCCTVEDVRRLSTE